MSTPVGELKEQIKIEKRSKSQGGSGEQHFTWGIHLETRSDVDENPMQGSRNFDEGTEYTEIDTEFRIRYRPDHGINESMRVVWQGNYYTIEAVTRDDSMRRWLYLQCTKEDVEVAR